MSSLFAYYVNLGTGVGYFTNRKIVSVILREARSKGWSLEAHHA